MIDLLVNVAGRFQDSNVETILLMGIVVFLVVGFIKCRKELF